MTVKEVLLGLVVHKGDCHKLENNRGYVDPLKRICDICPEEIVTLCHEVDDRDELCLQRYEVAISLYTTNYNKADLLEVLI